MQLHSGSVSIRQSLWPRCSRYALLGDAFQHGRHAELVRACQFGELPPLQRKGDGGSRSSTQGIAGDSGGRIIIPKKSMRIFPARLDFVIVATYVSGASFTMVWANALAQALTSSQGCCGTNGTTVRYSGLYYQSLLRTLDDSAPNGMDQRGSRDATQWRNVRQAMFDRSTNGATTDLRFVSSHYKRQP
jgi:hypothetical protein